MAGWETNNKHLKDNAIPKGVNNVFTLSPGSHENDPAVE